MVRPQSADTDDANCLDSFEQSAVVEGTADGIPPTVEIIPDESLAIVEFPGRDEDGGVGDVVAVADVTQFDALFLAREALEGEVDVGEAHELYLDAKTIFRVLAVQSSLLGGSTNVAKLGG